MRAVLLAGVACLLGACASYIGVSEWVGRPLPPLDLSHPLQGERWEPGELLGSVAVIEVFQAGCPGCIYRSMPRAQQMHERFRGDPRVRVVAVATALHEEEAPWMADDRQIVRVLREHGWTMPVMRDARNDICNLLAVGERAGTPTTVVLDRHGVVRWHGFSSSGDASDQIDATVRELLSTGR